MKVSPFIWGISSRVTQQVLSFANTLILARFLSPEEFGKVGVLAILIKLATLLADSGMGGSLVKEQNLTKKDCSTVFVFNLFFSCLLYLILFFLAPAFEHYFSIDGLTAVSRVATLPFVINALTIVPRSLCIKRLEFDKIFYVTLLSTLLSIIIAVFLAWKGCGVWALISYSIANAFFSNIGFHIVGKYLPSLSFSLTSFKKLFSFGLFTTLSAVIDTIYENVLSILLGKNVGAVEVGYYSQAKKIEEAPSLSLSITVGSVAFPILCKIVDDQNAFKMQAKKIQSTLMSLATPVMLLLSVYSKPIISFLLGDDWLPASHYLSLLSIAGIFLILENTNRTFIKSEGRSDLMFFLAVIKRTISILILLISMSFGINAVLWAYVFTTFFCMFMNATALAKISSFSLLEQVLNWIRIAIPNLLLFLLLRFILSLNISFFVCLSLIVVSLIAYFFALPLFGIKEIKSVIANYLRGLLGQTSS